MNDQFSVPVGTSNIDAVKYLDEAILDYLKYRGDPISSVTKAVEADKNLTIGWSVIGMLYLYDSLKPTSLQITNIRKELSRIQAEKKDLSNREKYHIQAFEHWCNCDFTSAEESYCKLLKEYPLDLIALKLVTDSCFFSGNNWGIRNHCELVINEWRQAANSKGGIYNTGFGLAVGILTFGLEETGEYAKAMEAAVESLKLNPDDSWTIHAVVHVHEMRGEIDEGIKYIETQQHQWEKATLFATHLWWHYCLFLMEKKQFERVLKIFNEKIRGKTGTLDLVDAASLLWRMELKGLTADQKFWLEVLNMWSPHADDYMQVFNDLHVLMVAVGSHSNEGKEVTKTMMSKLNSIQSAYKNGHRKMDSYTKVLELGLKVANAFIAYGEGKYIDVVTTLYGVPNKLQPIGGSHAQRDIVYQTMLVSMVKLNQDIQQERTEFRKKTIN